MRHYIRTAAGATMIIILILAGYLIRVGMSPPDLIAFSNDLRSLYARSVPSVVLIEATVSKIVAGKTMENAWYGAGTIISPTGEILTAWHLVDDRTAELNVTYFAVDRKGALTRGHAEAHLIGAAPEMDLALLKIDAKDLRPMMLGSSLARGEPVIAIGHPFGKNVITLGVVSHDAHWAAGHYFALTDAAINPGNSGGPLINMSGELIGINVSTFYRYNGETSGIGGAVSIVDVNLLLPRLREGGIFYKSYLGLQMYDNGDPDNLFIISVDQDSPAEKAGLKNGDWIIAIDGKAISTRVELTRATYSQKPGMEIVFTILREGEMICKKVYLLSPSHYSKKNNQLTPRP